MTNGVWGGGRRLCWRRFHSSMTNGGWGTLGFMASCFRRHSCGAGCSCCGRWHWRFLRTASAHTALARLDHRVWERRRRRWSRTPCSGGRGSGASSATTAATAASTSSSSTLGLHCRGGRCLYDKSERPWLYNGVAVGTWRNDDAFRGRRNNQRVLGLDVGRHYCLRNRPY